MNHRLTVVARSGQLTEPVERALSAGPYREQLAVNPHLSVSMWSQLIDEVLAGCVDAGDIAFSFLDNDSLAASPLTDSAILKVVDIVCEYDAEAVSGDLLAPVFFGRPTLASTVMASDRCDLAFLAALAQPTISWNDYDVKSRFYNLIEDEAPFYTHATDELPLLWRATYTGGRVSIPNIPVFAGEDLDPADFDEAIDTIEQLGQKVMARRTTLAAITLERNPRLSDEQLQVVSELFIGESPWFQHMRPGAGPSVDRTLPDSVKRDRDHLVAALATTEHLDVALSVLDSGFDGPGEDFAETIRRLTN